jgi:small subunit ribosomal protein S16
MAVRIRMRRIGKNPKGRPHFRISVFDETRSRDGRFIEELGYYSPVSGTVKVKQERLDFWVKNGAQVSQAVKNIVKRANKV